LTNLNLALPFYKQLARNPSRLALSVNGAHYTYSELGDLVGRTAQWLRARLSGDVHRVGLLASRSLEAYAGALAAGWAGAAYVPLSPKLPPARLLQVLDLTRLDAIIVDQGSVGLVEGLAPGCPRHVIAPCMRTAFSVPDGRGAELRVASCADLPPYDETCQPETVGPDDLAYIEFTSGTTGVPKGVMIAAEGVEVYLSLMQNRCQLEACDRLAETSDLTFDISVFNTFMTWRSAASLHVVPASQVLAPLRFIKENGITVWVSVPSTASIMNRMRMLQPGVFPSLRCTIFMGEPLPVGAARAWQIAAPNSIIENHYGPTEATVVCLGQRVSEPIQVTPNRGIVAIGTPFPGTEVEILDAALNPVARGQTGEIALGGVQVAKGYFGDPQLTASRFPVRGGKVWYLTGDLGYQDVNGIYHYLGRSDNQIKILGNRVELEEIEGHLREISGTEMVAAVAWPMEHGTASGIVAFLSGAKIPIADIRQAIASRVASYMVPTRFVEIPVLPLNANGKIDRKELGLRLSSGLL
jgi:amino acid adenylation domain-containing protein